MLDELDQPTFVEVIEKSSNVGVKNVVHPLPQKRIRQRIQRLMLATPRAKSSGFLTTYHVHSKESKDIASDDATQPEISPDGKRVMYTTVPAPNRNELWVSDIDGEQQGETCHWRNSENRHLGSGQFSLGLR